MARKNNKLIPIATMAAIALILAVIAYGYVQYGTIASANTPNTNNSPLPPAVSQTAPAVQEQEQQTQEISIDASSTGFYLDGKKITTLDVQLHSLVTLSIHVPQNVGYYGLIFKSSRFPDLKVSAGETGVVEFGSEGAFEIISHKPATATSPAEAEIAVLRVVAQ